MEKRWVLTGHDLSTSEISENHLNAMNEHAGVGGENRRLVPDFILQAFAEGRFRGRMNAATLFIDVSGFSKLSDLLMQHGREGIEVLTDIINQVFDPIIDEVYARQGFISTFAGDAFTGIFPLEGEQELSRAIVAASGIQALMAQKRHLYTRLGTFSLAVKIGVDVGDVEWGILGPEESRTYYFRGPAINGCARVESLAHAGEIIVTSTVWKRLNTHVRGEPVDAAYRLTGHTFDIPREPPHLAPLSPELLASFVPENILHRHLIAEFRNVCNVFISFQDPATSQELDAFITSVMSLTRIYGGYFNKVDFGDKGNVILLLFGAPTAYENNVERALEFLLALRQSSPPVVWRAGMTYGTAYTGFVGGRARSEYTAIGDVVNLASRLMTAAPWHHILTDARVQRQARERYTFGSLGRKRVKGKPRPILVYRLLGRRAITVLPPIHPFVGRERELEQLQTWLAALETRKQPGPFIHVYGEAGIGKTRFVEEGKNRWRQHHPIQWLFCPVDEILRQSFNPFVYALKHYFSQSPERTREENVRAFRRELAALMDRLPQEERAAEIREELERTSSFLAALMDLHWKDSLYEEVEPRLRFENTLIALITFFKALSFSAPLIIGLDGGHLLDRDSRTLLQRMLQELADWPVAIIVTGRASAHDSHLPGSEEGVWQEIRLGPLSEEEVSALAASVLGRDLAPRASRILHETTGGNPLFVEQLVQYLQERGAFITTNEPPGTLDLRTSDLTDVPTTVDALLISRLDQLPLPLREVIQKAAVLGREFETPILERMVDHPDALPSLIRAGETENIWRPRGTLRYRFVQPMLRDVAYQMQMRERLRILHRRAGEAYERVHAKELAPYYADLAYHFEKGEEHQKAAYYLRKAGDQARENYQNEQALAFYERLLAYADEEEQGEIYEYRGDIFHSMGSYAQALESYASALEIRLRRKAPLRVADIARKIASIHVDKGEYNVALDWLDRARQRVRGKDSPELARILLLVAGIAYRQGDIQRALKTCETARDIAERIHALPEQAHAYRLLGTIHTGLGDLHAAVEDYKRSLTLCQDLHDLRQQSMASNSLAVVYYYLGDLDKAETMYKHSLEIATRIGFVDQQATVANNLGELYMLQGRFDEAEVQFRQCLRTWQRTGFLLGVALSLRNLAQIAVNREQWPNAEQQLKESLRVLKRLDSRDWVLAEVYRLLAEVKLAQSQPDLARSYAQQALDIVTAQNIKLVESNVRRTWGILYREEGVWEKALSELQRSVALARELGLRYEEGKAWLELARLYRAWKGPRDPLAQEAAERARTIFQALGAAWDIKQVPIE